MLGEKTAKLSVLGCALALGITWGFCALLAGWTAMFGWGSMFVHTMSSVYIGYKSSFIGGIVGGLWGFFDGFIGGVIFSFLYNKLKR